MHIGVREDIIEQEIYFLNLPDVLFWCHSRSHQIKDYPLLAKPKPPPPAALQPTLMEEWTIATKKGKGKVSTGEHSIPSTSNP